MNPENSESRVTFLKPLGPQIIKDEGILLHEGERYTACFNVTVTEAATFSPGTIDIKWSSSGSRSNSSPSALESSTMGYRVALPSVSFRHPPLSVEYSPSAIAVRRGEPLDLTLTLRNNTELPQNIVMQASSSSAGCLLDGPSLKRLLLPPFWGSAIGRRRLWVSM